MRLWDNLKTKTNSRTFRAIQVAVLIGITAQVKVQFLTGIIDGFVIALDVVIMGVFIYCYEDVKPIEIVGLSAICSPLFRTLFMTVNSHSLQFSAAQAFPDAAFFIGYGLTYAFIAEFIIENPKEFKHFPYVAFFCDLFGNTTELLVRSIIVQQLAYSAISLSLLIVIALFRTVALIILVIAIDAYSDKLVSNERIKEYERLLEKFTVIQEEITLMDKNARDVEASMREAYDLYQKLDGDDTFPENVSGQALEIAKRTHEIKADYYNVISVLKGLFDEKDFSDSRKLSSTIRLVVRNAQEYAQKLDLHVSFIVDIREDREIEHTYKLMSILRNLLMNSVDAVGKKAKAGIAGVIQIKVEPVDDEASSCRIIIEDNGSGIPEDRLGMIFRPGFSTKFNMETGFIQRGLGLSIVKTYIEEDFGGRISVESVVDRFTRFTIELPDGERGKDN